MSPKGREPHGAPSVAAWKLASCDGCQLTLLDSEDDLLSLASRVRIVHFAELTEATAEGPYDLSLVEGSVTTTSDAVRVRDLRRASRTLVTIGACAAAGGIQALRNLAEPGAYARGVYAHPAYLDSLEHATPVSAHVRVDFELWGCPVDRRSLLEVVTAFLAGRRPVVPDYSVCEECKARGNTCVVVREKAPCLGPVTRAGCGAPCPAFGRGCIGCFGPADTAHTAALGDRLEALGATPASLSRLFRTFNAAAPAFRKERLARAPRNPPR